MANKFLALQHIFNYSLCKSYRTSFQNIFHITNRNYGSALYISGRYAKKRFALLTPHFDFEERFLDIDKLQKQFELRKVNLNASKMKETWEFYKSINSRILALDAHKKEISIQIKQLIDKEEKTPQDEELLAKLYLHAKIIKDDVKAVREIQWDLDESVIIELLKLPNELDERTPAESPIILKQVGDLYHLQKTNKKDHMEIGKALALLEYTNPMQYYLSNEAALFELGILNFAAKILDANAMIRIAGSDFCNSVLVEGSGLDHEDHMDSFILENANGSNDLSNTLHLVGGASLISMLALHVKDLIDSKFFPIKYYSTGRHYTPFPEGATPHGLFNVCQASAVQVFLIVNDAIPLESNKQFENLIEITSEIYSNITDHYRVVIRPAPELLTCEKLRVSFELWSPFLEQYIETGHISIHGKYFSKRLLLGCETNEDTEFPSILSGTILSVPRVLGCLLETNPDRFIIPPKVAEQMLI